MSRINSKLSEVSKGMSSVQAILITFGAIITLLISGYYYARDSIVQSQSEQIAQNLSKHITSLGIVTDSKLDSAIQAQNENQERVLDKMLELHETQINEVSQISGSMRQYGTQIEQVEQEIRTLKKLLIETSKQVGGKVSDNAKLIEERAYTDSLQNELQKALIEKSSIEIRRELEDYYQEQINEIKKAQIEYYPAKSRRTSKGVKMMLHQKKAGR
jgi:uncharacterized membrane protein YciS (DUF1049 family)